MRIGTGSWQSFVTKRLGIMAAGPIAERNQGIFQLFNLNNTLFYIFIFYFNIMFKRKVN